MKTGANNWVQATPGSALGEFVAVWPGAPDPGRFAAALMRIKSMKTQNAPPEMHTGTIRAGVISLLVPLLCNLWMTGPGDLPRLWLFIVLFAVCFVLMMKSIVDLLVLAFGFAARLSGTGVGRSVRAVRRLFPHAPNAA